MNNSVVRLVDYVVKHVLGPNGVLSISKLVDKLTKGTGRINLTHKDLAMATFSFPLPLANITVGLLELNATGLNTWGNVQFFPRDRYTLAFLSELDYLDLNATFFVNVTSAAKDLHSPTLYEEGAVIIKLRDNNLNASAQVALKADALSSMKPDQYAYLECILDAIQDITFTQIFMNTTVVKVSIMAIDGDLEKDVDEMIDNVLELFTSSFGPAIPAFFNGFVGEPARKQANRNISEILSRPKSCPQADVTAQTFNRDITIFSFTGVGLIFVGTTIFLLIAQTKSKKVPKNQENLPLLVSDLASVEASKFFDEPPIALDRRLSFWIRLAIPLLILFNIGLFVSANASIGASVFAEITIGDDVSITTGSLFTFSLESTVRDMWKAGVYPLAILIAVFSGAWPYIKLVTMLVSWFAPSSVLKSNVREGLLMVLDGFGKWSLIDAFVMVLMMVAFRFHLYSAPSGISAIVVRWNTETYLLLQRINQRR